MKNQFIKSYCGKVINLNNVLFIEEKNYVEEYNQDEDVFEEVVVVHITTTSNVAIQVKLEKEKWEEIQESAL